MRKAETREMLPVFFSGVIHSYTQVFFSNNRLFGWILIVVSFFDLWAGISGLTAVLASNIIALLTGFNRENIRHGYYGFNSLLVGLGLGLWYEPGAGFLLVLLVSSLLTFFITIAMENVIGKYGLPFLSIPFLISLWTMELAARQFTALEVSETGIYNLNEMYRIGGAGMVDIYRFLQETNLPGMVRLYFRSLGAIFFQYHLVAGILIACGLLIYSRIAFLLSVIGFASAWYYYHFLGADMMELSAGYIGFNFILTAIAAGGFFILPSRYSILWVILLTPVISVFLISSVMVFSLFHLSVYSLPFNLTVLLFLYILKFRERNTFKPQLVLYQQFSPEKNLYSHLNSAKRFGQSWHLPVSLPFYGFWKVTQGHNGEHTHRGDWKHAWDFELADENDKTFSGKGTDLHEYYCFDKPLLAPADGIVEEIADGIDDNPPGLVDLEHNWGNTIIIRHGEHLYSKLSHLRKGSFRVQKGDHIKRGDIIAHCGNSGRSPYPHVHFQLQATPFVGSRTLDYPFDHYIRREKGWYHLCIADRPAGNDNVSNVEPNPSLEKSWLFIPGQEFAFQVKESSALPYLVRWEVRADALNNTYLCCLKTGSKAWFRCVNHQHYFTHFDGDKRSLLFYYYLGGYRVIAGYYPGLRIHDTLPLHTFNRRIVMLFQDLLAPFVIFSRTTFDLEYKDLQDELTRSGITMSSEVRFRFAGKTIRSIRYEFYCGREGIERWTVTEARRQLEITAVKS